MKYIGLDVGNGSVCLYVRTESGQVFSDVYPAVYGVYNAKAQAVQAQKSKMNKIDNVFSFENKDYVLGYNNVQAAAATPISAYDREARVSRREFQTLTKLALIDAATRDGSVDVIEVELGIGTPAEDYRDDIIEVLHTWFADPIVGRKNGQQVVIMVKKLEVISQPVAVLMDRYVDDEGYVQDETLEDGKTLVIDCGSGTMDMTVFDGLIIIEQASEPIGMNDVYKALMQEIQRKNPKIRPNIYDIERQVREQQGSDKLIYTFGQAEPINLTEQRKEIMDDTWQRMLGAITQRFPDRLQFNHIFLAGGTGDAFWPYFQEWSPKHPRIELLEDPQLAIARGLCKYVLANTQEVVYE